MIISGGENIYCAEVENVLSGHPTVADVAVIGARHDKWGETPVAVAVPADPAAPPTLEDLTGWTAGRLASYKKPTSLVVLDELPRNAAARSSSTSCAPGTAAAPRSGHWVRSRVRSLGPVIGGSSQKGGSSE